MSRRRFFDRVIVVRQAYCDTPDRVMGHAGADQFATILGYYPTAVFDGIGGFDTADGGSYLFDIASIDN